MKKIILLLVATILLVIIVQVTIGVKAKHLADLKAAQEKAAILEKTVETQSGKIEALELKVQELGEEIELLEKPYAKTLELLSTWPDICRQIPIGILLQSGDAPCGRVLDLTAETYPDNRARLAMFRSPPDEALQIIRKETVERCLAIKLDRGERLPDICLKLLE